MTALWYKMKCLSAQPTYCASDSPELIMKYLVRQEKKVYFNLFLPSFTIQFSLFLYIECCLLKQYLPISIIIRAIA